MKPVLILAFICISVAASAFPQDQVIPQNQAEHIPGEESGLETAADQTAPEIPQATGKDTFLETGFGIGAEIFHIKYEEPRFMEESGFMLGIYGNYILRPNNFMLKFDGRFSTGKVNYRSPISGTINGIRDYLFETRFTLGHDFQVSPKAYITPFGGIGYRYLFDVGEGRVSSYGDVLYNRKSNYLYSPIGLESTFDLEHRWSLAVSGEYDLFWHGWQFNDDYPLNADSGFSFKNDQHDGWGARASLRANKNFNTFSFAVSPYFRYWNIDFSDKYNIGDTLTVSEPANNSLEVGAGVGFRF